MKVVIGLAIVALGSYMLYWWFKAIDLQNRSSFEKQAALGCLRSVAPLAQEEWDGPAGRLALTRLERGIGRARNCQSFPLVCVPPGGASGGWTAAIQLRSPNGGYWLMVDGAGLTHPVSFSTQGPPTGSIVIRNPSFVSSRWEPPKQAP